jgi:hypothetical protein
MSRGAGSRRVACRRTSGRDGPRGDVKARRRTEKRAESCKATPAETKPSASPLIRSSRFDRSGLSSRFDRSGEVGGSSCSMVFPLSPPVKSMLATRFGSRRRYVTKECRRRQGGGRGIGVLGRTRPGGLLAASFLLALVQPSDPSAATRRSGQLTKVFGHLRHLRLQSRSDSATFFAQLGRYHGMSPPTPKT